jgi:hypothetical protein
VSLCSFVALHIYREIEIDMQEVISIFAHQKKRKLYGNIVESGVKHHNPNTNHRFYIKILGGQDKIPPDKSSLTKSHADKRTDKKPFIIK